MRVLIASSEELQRSLSERVERADPRYRVTTSSPAQVHELEREHDIVLLDVRAEPYQLPRHSVAVLLADDPSAHALSARVLEVIELAKLDELDLGRILRHVSEICSLRSRLHESHERHELLLRATNDGVWECELGSGQVRYSARWAHIMGLHSQQLQPTLDTWFSRVHRDDIAGLRAAVEALQTGASQALEFEHRVTRPDGTQRWMLSRGLVRNDDRGRPVALAGSLTDIDARKIAELDSVDELTGLPSRRVLIERLEQAVGLASDDTEFNFSVLFLNLDRFKLLNDSIGLDSADRLLVMLARRMRAEVQEQALLCRYGGDEFAVLLEGIEDFAQAKRVAEILQQCLDAPFDLDGQSLHTTASIGIANSHPTNYTSASEVIRDATIATSKAKQGGSRVVTFVPDWQLQAAATHQTETQLREALERDEFVVYYQPIVALGSCRLTGFEALVRWQHPRRGIVGPGEFIPIAEDLGLIIPLGRVVFRHACTQMAAWHEQFPDAADISISINLSGHQLRSSTLTSDIDQILEDTGLNPEKIKIELTESTLIDEEAAALTILGYLRSRGIKLYIDDFGTGYSSLSYLHKFSIDGLKIDKSFVDTVGQDDRKAAIVPSIVGLAHNLGMRVVAEGVEEATQARELNLLDCGEAQGYLYSKPVPALEAAKLIERRILCDEDYTR